MKTASGASYIEIDKGVMALTCGLPFRLDQADAVIFDVDGVLVEVSDSFRQVISLTVQFYFNRILEIPGQECLIRAEETGHFKLAGRFNNDWELAKGAVAHLLLKFLSANGTHPITMERLRETPPLVEDFTAEVKKCGGGLKETIKLVKGKLGESLFREFESHYKPGVIKKIFMEYYAGPQLCRSFYGFDPEYYRGPGLIEKEQVILDLSLIRRLAVSGISFGILSGRTTEEAAYFFRKTGLEEFLKPEFVITDDGTLPGKPDPAGLQLLAKKMGFRAGIYVGDVPDDWTAVKNYRLQNPGGPPIACCMVRTGATSAELMTEFYAESLVDFLATDVNCLLSAMAQISQSG